jgi:hypothetical protein
VANWIVKAATLLHIRRHPKVKATPFGAKNGKTPFNASGVAHVGLGRFIFIDNHDPSAFFELTLDADGTEAERVVRRPLKGVAKGELRDPEGLTRVDAHGEIFLIAASSLCIAPGGGGASEFNDGLVRVRYTPHGDLQAEAMHGFRAWLLAHEPTLAGPGATEADAGGLNIEGIAWDPRAGALLFGLRGPADPGRIAVVRVPVHTDSPAWTTASLKVPSIVRARIPRSSATPGIRDISYDEQTGEFLILLGRSTSSGTEPFQLCTWNGHDDEVTVLDVRFHRSMKPEGITTFARGGERHTLVVDDNGGYAVLDQ